MSPGHNGLAKSWMIIRHKPVPCSSCQTQSWNSFFVCYAGTRFFSDWADQGYNQLNWKQTYRFQLWHALLLATAESSAEMIRRVTEAEASEKIMFWCRYWLVNGFDQNNCRKWSSSWSLKENSCKSSRKCCRESRNIVEVLYRRLLNHRGASWGTRGTLSDLHRQERKLESQCLNRIKSLHLKDSCGSQLTSTTARGAKHSQFTAGIGA